MITTTPETSAVATPQRTPELVYPLVALFSTLVIHVAVSLSIGTNGWDDGAITLAFLQPFSEHGTIAASDVERASAFVKRYRPIAIEGISLHLRGDVFERIQYLQSRSG